MREITFKLPHYLHSNVLLYRCRKTVQAIIWSHKIPQIVKASPRRKNTIECITIPILKLNYKFIVIKTVWFWNKNWQVQHWNRIEDMEISEQSSANLILTKEQNICSGKMIKSSTNGAGKIGYHLQKDETIFISLTFSKKELQWIIDLDVKSNWNY